MNDHGDDRSEAADLRDRFAEAAPVILVDPEPVARRARRRRAVTRAATGLGALVAVLAVVLLVRPGGGAWTGPPAGEPPPEPERPVSIEVVPRVVPPGDVVTAVLLAHEANDLTFGVPAEVERWDGRAWRRAGAVHLCLVEWECVGEVVDRLDGALDIGLSATPGTAGPATVLSTDGLEDGWYRLVQRAALDEGLASGVFEVRTDAPAAAPHPAPDEVRLAVTPVLVPPTGGLVDVMTLVPAGPDGTLTAEDIEAVDETLAPSALLQRWVDERWEDVGDVPVGEPADEGVEWGARVALPALDEGSYRLVRERPGADPVWGVFTVVSGAPELEPPEAPSGDDA